MSELRRTEAEAAAAVVGFVWGGWIGGESGGDGRAAAWTSTLATGGDTATATV